METHIKAVHAHSSIFPNVSTNLIPEEVTNVAEPVPVDPEVKFSRRGRPETSALKAEVDDIKDQGIRRRKFNNASSARSRRNEKQKQGEIEKELVIETERNAKLTVEVEKLEKMLKALRQRYFLLSKVSVAHVEKH